MNKQAMTEREYDRLYNEGGDGYNPIREERLAAERAAERARPKTLSEQRYNLLRKIEALDCSSARESGTYDAAEVDSLRVQMAKLEAQMDADFLGVWTREVTMARRANWNARVQAGEFEDGHSYYTAIAAQGWTLNDLRRAIALHNL